MENRLKRFLSMMLAIVMTFSCVPTPAFATESSTENCDHQYGEYTITAAPTCNAVGEETAVCLIEGCGATTTREVPATGEHTYENSVCSVCGTSEPVEAVPTTTVAPEADPLSEENGEKPVVPDIPTASFGEKENDALTFACSFAIGEVSEDQLTYYGSWRADYVLKANKTVLLNADGTANGYVSGRYDFVSEDWFEIPGEALTLEAGKELHLLQEQKDSLLTFEEIYTTAKVFECGVFLAPEFILTNTDLEIEIELRLFDPTNEENYHVLGETCQFRAVDLQPQCNHQFVEYTVTTDATCVDEGEETAACQVEGCDATTTRKISATGIHTYENDSCTVCGAEDPDAEAPDGENPDGEVPDGENHDEGEDNLTEVPELPSAFVSELSDTDLTYGLNVVPVATNAQLAFYGDWHADVVLISNKNAILPAEVAISGRYDANGAGWFNIPTESMMLEAGVALPILESFTGAGMTFDELCSTVKDLDCGMKITPAFLKANPDLELRMELRLYNPADETVYHVLGGSHDFKATVGKNERTGQCYTDLNSALSDAQENDTILLMQDAQVKRVMIYEQSALDLNGYTLTANYVNCYGNIVDTSSDTSGLLKVSSKGLLIQENNEQLPVETEAGIRFVEILKFNRAVLESGTKYAFQPVFEEVAHAEMLKGVDLTGVTVVVHVSWDYEGGRRTQTFTYSDEQLRKYINSYIPETGEYGQMFSLTLTNVDRLPNLNFTGAVVWKDIVEATAFTSTAETQNVTKFRTVSTATEYAPNTTITVGQLFAAVQNVKPSIDREKVQVTVTPVDDTSTAGAVYMANTTDWRKGTLTFSGLGMANITITDGYFCDPTTFIVMIKPVDVRKFVAVENVIATKGALITLGELYTAVSGMVVDSSLVKIAVIDENGNELSDQYTFAPNESDWTGAALTAKVSGKLTVRITEGPYTYSEDTLITVIEHKFRGADETRTWADAGETFTLGELFAEVSGASVVHSEVAVKVLDSSGAELTGVYTFVPNTENWMDSTLTFQNAGKVKVVISEGVYTYEASADITVMEYKFQKAKNATATVDAGQTISLDKLFAEIIGAKINSANVVVHVESADFTYTPNSENWKAATLSVASGGKVTVTISEDASTHTQSTELMVMEHKFQKAEGAAAEADAGEAITLGQLFDAVQGAKIVSGAVEVRITGSDFTYTPNAENWKAATLTVKTGGNVTVFISEDAYTYEESASLKITEHKFQSAQKPVTEVDAGQEITLGQLFAPVDGVAITNTMVKITVTDAAGNPITNKYSFTSKASDWMASTLTIKTGGVITVTISENGFTYPKSAVLIVTAEKFEALQTVPKTVEANQAITLGELFKAVEGADIDSSKITITVTGESNVDLTGKYTFTLNEEDWTASSLTVTSGVNATVTIHEDDHTYPVTAGLKVMEHKFCEADPVLTQADVGDVITLGELFDAVAGAQIISGDVLVTVTGAEYIYTENADNWKEATLTILSGGEVKITISENNCTHALTMDLTVMEKKFSEKKNIQAQTANTDIVLGDLFEALEGANIISSAVKVTVTDEAGAVLGGKYTDSLNEDDWTKSTVNIKTGGKVKVVIWEDGYNTYEAVAEVTVKEEKFTFASSLPERVDAKDPIKLGTLFNAVTGAQITGGDVLVTVTGAEYTYTLNADNWKDATFTILSGGEVTVTISEGQYTYEKELELTVMEHKFQRAEAPITKVNAGDEITLGKLFAAVEGASFNGQITVTVMDADDKVLLTITPNVESWETALLSVDVGGAMTVKIEESGNTHPFTVPLTVMETLFALRSDAPTKVTAGEAILLGDLFEALKDADYAGSQIEVTVTDEAGRDLANAPTVDADAEEWKDVSVTIHAGSKVKVTIREKDNDYCNSASAVFEVWENKFRAKQESQTVDAGVFKLDDLFEAVSDTVISSQVRAEVTGITGCSIIHDNTDWTQGTITIPTGGEAVITLSEGTYTKTVNTSLKVMEYKFVTQTDVAPTIDAGTITLGEIFAKKGNAQIDAGLVDVSIEGISGAAFVRNEEDWTASQLVLPVGGVAVITISENNYTHTAHISLTVMEDKFAQQDPAQAPVNVGDEITLGKLFRANDEVTIDPAKVTISVTSNGESLTAGEDYTLTKPEDADWTEYVLAFKRTGDMVIEIGEVYTDTKTASLRVNVDKFVPKESIAVQTALTDVLLNTLFENIGEVTGTSITVTYPDNTTSKSSVVWNDGVVKLSQGGSVKIEITDAKDSYCNTAVVWIDVVENKFAAKLQPITEANADHAFKLGDLFENGAFGSKIDIDKLAVIVKSGEAVLIAGADYTLDTTKGSVWTDYELTVAAGGNITVTVTELNNIHCNSVTLPLTVSEQKFQGISGKSVDAMDTITLGDLFSVYGDANVAADAVVSVSVKRGGAELIFGADYFLTPGTGWADTELSFAHGGDVTVTIQDSTVNCLSESTDLKVMEHKFHGETVTGKTAGTVINLGELFELNEGAQVKSADVNVTVALDVTVDGVDTLYRFVKDSTDWTKSTLTLYTGAKVTVMISANDGCTYGETMTFTVTADKFQRGLVSDQVNAGTELTMAQLFTQVNTALPIDSGNVEVTVTGVDETDRVLVEDDTNWQNTKLTVNAGAQVTVGIRDSEYTDWEYETFNVIATKFADQTDAPTGADVGDTITLGQLFQKNGDVTIDSSKVTITVKSGIATQTEGEDYTLTKPEGADWTEYALTFLKTGEVKVYINEEYTYTQDASLQINADKFTAQEDISVQTMNVPITVGDLFTSEESVSRVAVTLTYEDGSTEEHTVAWPGGTVTPTKSGTVAIAIKDADDPYCNKAFTDMTVKEKKLTGKTGVADQTAGEMIHLTNLFTIEENAVIDISALAVTVTDANGEPIPAVLNVPADADDWTDCTLTISASGDVTVKLTELADTHDAQVSFRVKEDKFKSADGASAQVDADTVIEIGTLFTEVENAVVTDSIVEVTGEGVTFIPNPDDWTLGTVEIAEGGSVTLTITEKDNVYCNPYSVQLTVKEYKFDAATDLGDQTVGQSLKLGTLFSQRTTAEVNSNQVTIEVSGLDENGYSFIPNTSNWTEGRLTVHTGSKITVTIKEVSFAYTESIELTVIENRFAFVAEPLTETFADEPIMLGKLFTEGTHGDNIDPDEIAITIIGSDKQETITTLDKTDAENWKQYAFCVEEGDAVTVRISGGIYTNQLELPLTVNEKKFVKGDVTSVDTGNPIPLSELFGVYGDAQVDSEKVDVTVSAINATGQAVPCTVTENTEDWTARRLTVPSGSSVTVTIGETGNPYCETEEITFFAMDSKFYVLNSEPESVDAGSDIRLASLFAPLDDAEIVGTDVKITVTDAEGEPLSADWGYTAIEDWQNAVLHINTDEPVIVAITDSDYTYVVYKTLKVVQEKFEPAGEDLVKTAGVLIELGELFDSKGGVTIDSSKVTVSVETDAEYDLERNTTDWTKGTLTVSSGGEVTVTISETEYAKSAEITLDVKDKKFDVQDNVTTAIATNYVVTLGDLFKAVVADEQISDQDVEVTLTVDGEPLSAETYEYNGEATSWKERTLKFKSGGDITVTISEKTYTHTAELTLDVTANKFAKKNVADAPVNTEIHLYDIFAQVQGTVVDSTAVEAVVTDSNGNVLPEGWSFTPNTSDWTQGVVIVENVGDIQVKITEDVSTEPQVISLRIKASKFTTVNNLPEKLDADSEILISSLFAAQNDVAIDSTQVDVSVTGAEGSFTLNEQNWTQSTLTIGSGGPVTITISEGDYTYAYSLQVTVWEDKFDVKTEIPDQSVGAPINLGTLFTPNGDAVITNGEVTLTVTVTDAKSAVHSDKYTFNNNGTTLWSELQLYITTGGCVEVTIHENGYTYSETAAFDAIADKFDKVGTSSSEHFEAGETIYLYQLFDAVDDSLTIDSSQVKLTVSGAGNAYEHVEDDENWKNGTLTVKTGAMVTVRIEEDTYTETEEITFEVRAKKFKDAAEQPETKNVETKIYLSELFDANIEGQYISSDKVQITVTNTDGTPVSEDFYTLNREAEHWTGYYLTFHRTGQVKIKITEEFTYAEDMTLKVMTDKFTTKENIPEQTAGTPISFSTFFENHGQVEAVSIRVIYSTSESPAESAANWANGTVTLRQGGRITIEIKDSTDEFCNYTPVTINVIENKFAVKTDARTEATADQSFLLGEMFTDGAHFHLSEGETLKLTVMRGETVLTEGVHYKLDTTAENWKNYSLTIYEGGSITVSVAQQDNAFCNEVSGSLTVMEHKFQAQKENETLDVSNPISLNALFKVYEGAAVENFAEVTCEVKNSAGTVIASGTTEGGWKNHELRFSAGDKYTVTISESGVDHCIPATANITVVEHKFTAIKDKTFNAGTPICLSDLFTAVEGVQINDSEVTITSVSVEASAYTKSKIDDDWTKTSLTFYNGGEMTVKIKAGDCSYEETVTFTVNADKFTVKPQSEQIEAGTSFTLDQLFGTVDNMIINTVTVTVSGVADKYYTLTENADWTQRKLTVNTGAKVTVAITDDATYTTAKSNDLIFIANKFSKNEEAPASKDVNETVTLGELFKGVDVISDDVQITVKSGEITLAESTHYTMTKDSSDWRNTALSFHQTGNVQVYIRETYTHSASANLKIMENVFSGDVTKNVTAAMPFTFSFSQYLTLADPSDSVNQLTVNEDTVYGWHDELTITKGGVYTYKVTENGNAFCNPVTLTLTVTEDNFVSKDTVVKDEGDTIKLGDLFEIASSAEAVYVTVDGVENSNLTGADSVINLTAGKAYTFNITERGNEYSTSATATLKLREKKFQQAKATQDSQTVGEAFALTELVTLIEGKSVNSVIVTIDGAEYTHGGTWTDKLTVNTAGFHTVTITETDNDLCVPITVALTVKENKFTGEDTTKNTDYTSNKASVSLKDLFTQTEEDNVTKDITVTVTDKITGAVVDTIVISGSLADAKDLSFGKGGVYEVTIEEAGGLTNPETIELTVNEYKFKASEENKITTDTVALSNLFEARTDIDSATVSVVVKDNSSDATLIADEDYILNKGIVRSVTASDWSTWTLTLLKGGIEVTVEIKDEDYCLATSTTLTYEEQKFAMAYDDEYVAAGQIRLDTFFSLNADKTVEKVNVTVGDMRYENITWNDGAGTITISDGGEYTITITDAAGFCNVATVDVTVKENKFTSNGRIYSEPQKMPLTISLTDIFSTTEPVGTALPVLVSVNGEVQSIADFRNGSITLTSGGKYEIIIYQIDSYYCIPETASFTVTELNFKAVENPQPVKVNDTIALSHLFENVGSVTNVTVTVNGKEVNTTWADYKLPTDVSGIYTVTVTQTPVEGESSAYSNTANATLIVREEKLTAVSNVEKTAGSPFALKDLVNENVDLTLVSVAKDGTILESGFTFDDMLTISAPGTYVVTVTAKDDTLCAPVSVTVTVKTDKFDSVPNVVKNTTTVTLGEIFIMKTGMTISAGATVSYTVTDSNGDVVASVSGLTAEAWQSEQVTFSAGGKYTVIISESDPNTGSETNTITVNQPKFQALKNPVSMQTKTIKLSELFSLLVDANKIGTITITVTDLTTNTTMTAGNGYTFSGGSWTDYTLNFAKGCKVEVQIKDDQYSVPATVMLTVNEDKFAPVEITEPIATGKIPLTNLFTLASGVAEDGLNVIVTLDGNALPSMAWKGGTVSITTGGKHEVTITEAGNDFCITRTVAVPVKAEKFAATGTVVEKTLGQISLSALFSAASADINSASVQVTVKDTVSGKLLVVYTPDTSDWTKGYLTIESSGRFTVTITDGQYCIPAELTLVVSEEKFGTVENIGIQTAGEIPLTNLFTAENVTLVNLTVKRGGEISSQETLWENGNVTITEGGEYEVTITDANGDSNSVTVKVTVHENKFDPVKPEKPLEIKDGAAEVSIMLGKLFTQAQNASAIVSSKIKVTPANLVTATDASDWRNTVLTFTSGDEYTITVTDETYCYTAETTVTVNHQKFTVKDDAVEKLAYDCEDGHKTITLDDLFTAEGVEKVSVTVTRQNGETYEDITSAVYTADASDWKQGKLSFDKEHVGKVYILITDGAENGYCIPIEYEMEIIEQKNAIGLVFENTDKYLYRVGNLNEIKLSSLFTVDTNVLEENGITLGEASVEIVAMEGMEDSVSVSLGAVTDKWLERTIQFAGTGIVTISVCDDRIAEPVTLKLEVANAYNATTSSHINATSRNVVLLNDITFSTASVTNGHWLYGNGFTLTAPNDEAAQSMGYAFVSLNNGALENVQVKVPNYSYAILLDSNKTESGNTTSLTYGNIRSAVIMEGNSTISNSYVSGGRAAVYAVGGNPVLSNSTVEGGSVANIQVGAVSHITLRDMTLIQMPKQATVHNTEKTLMGLSVLFLCGADGSAPPITLEGNLLQYAWANKDHKAYVPSQLSTVVDIALQQDKFVHSVTYADGTTKNAINLGIIFAPGEVGNSTPKPTINDSRSNKAQVPYAQENVSYYGLAEAVVYSCVGNGSSPDASVGQLPDVYEPTVNGTVRPDIAFADTTTGLTFTSGYDATEGWNSKLTIDLDELGEYSFRFADLVVKKYGKALSYTVKDASGNAVDPNAEILLDSSSTAKYVLTITDDLIYDENGKLEQGATAQHIHTFNLVAMLTSRDKPMKVAEVSGTPLVLAKSYSGDWTAATPALEGVQIRYWSTTSKEYKILTLSSLTPGEVGPQNDDKNNNVWIYEGDDFTLTITGGVIHEGKSWYGIPYVVKYGGSYKLYFTIGSTDGYIQWGTNQRIITNKYKFEDKNGGVLEFSKTWTIKNADTSTYDGKQYKYSDFVKGTLTELKEGSGGGGCVTPDTLITLADGSQVRVDSLTGTEELLVWNMETGMLDSAPILFVDSESETENEVVHLYFSDGTDVKVVYEHGFWDYDLNRYVYLDHNAAQYIGHTFATQNGDRLSRVQLTDVVLETEVTTLWSPVTAGHLCYFVNGMLSMPGGVGGLFNIFDVDPATMTYDYEAMARDIETYGLFTYEEMNRIVPLPEEMFIAAGGAYLKVSIGKGNMTMDDLVYMIHRYTHFFA